MKHLSLAAAIVLMVVNFSSCSQKNMNSENNAITKEAQLEWSGEYMVDGCGFKLTIEGKDYKPEDESAISEEFKQEENLIPVKVTYTETGEIIDRRCGLSTQDRSMPGIRIISIEKL
ncbi:hypothetical protein JAO76_12080 [Pontibacter sp. BT310]|uniref:NlpE C-terminal OB domain-containing protein n=1 Tax=Pontibacter populi TaxID=890055 RepID=A0ABS6XCR2_9BACT|nr:MULTISPECIES: hypothetical protein [Pontibacter]MBJ6118937.1 hypothetical protein [Pontibacter sp. BT310]MBR0571365.1 hypothetical protein [Microvirga sp. STS03]MBW3365791.1 hypothetical protein [Pontibacter populi]